MIIQLYSGRSSLTDLSRNTTRLYNRTTYITINKSKDQKFVKCDIQVRKKGCAKIAQQKIKKTPLAVFSLNPDLQQYFGYSAVAVT